MSIATYLTGDSKKLRVGTYSSGASKYLFLAIDESGLRLASAQSSKLLLMIDHNEKLLQEFMNLGNDNTNCILIRTEPQSVRPDQYLPHTINRYGLVLTLGVLEASSNDFPWPYEINSDPCLPIDPILPREFYLSLGNFTLDYGNWQRRTKNLVLIASNKVSPISNNNYKLRRDLAKSGHLEILEVFGSMWSLNLLARFKHRLAVVTNSLKRGVIPNFGQILGGMFTAYRSNCGRVSDKHEVLRNSKFSLVVENDAGVITEKLFDSIINGCIPVYFGTRKLPHELEACVIRFDTCDVKEISLNLNGFSPEFIAKKLTSIDAFLNSSFFLDNLSAERVYKRLIQRCESYASDIGLND
jgi:hypothetical protein